MREAAVGENTRLRLLPGEPHVWRREWHSPKLRCYTLIIRGRLWTNWIPFPTLTKYQRASCKYRCLRKASAPDMFWVSFDQEILDIPKHIVFLTKANAKYINLVERICSSYKYPLNSLSRKRLAILSLHLTDDLRWMCFYWANYI